MSEIKRYDEALSEQLQHLPMPTEDFAWAEMKKLLDNDDEDPVVIPFFKRLGCWLPALLAALLLTIGGWFFFNNRQDTLPDSSASSAQKIKEVNENNSFPNSSQTVLNNISDSISGNTNIVTHSPDSTTGSTDQSGKNIAYTSGASTKISISSSNAVADTVPNYRNRTNNDQQVKAKARQTRSVSKGKNSLRISAAVTANENDRDDESGTQNKKPVIISENSDQTIIITSAIPDSSVNIIANQNADSAFEKNADSSNKKPTVTTKEKNNQPTETTAEENKKKNDWIFAAGLSVYQPIPIAGQSSVPFNYYGRKNGISDYIPSVYLRLYNRKKWFIHSEFRYAAPQAVKEIPYKAIIDSSNQNFQTSVYNLKKTYYHQLPLSFNYFLMPDLSLGAGLVYNRFTGAVVNLDKHSGIPGTPVDSILSSEIIREKNDDRFVKNKWQWSAEVQYNWKRFWLGARYSRDLQPYLKYTDTFTGERFEKYAQSLNIYLRFELWRSKKNR